MFEFIFTFKRQVNESNRTRVEMKLLSASMFISLFMVSKLNNLFPEKSEQNTAIETKVTFNVTYETMFKYALRILENSNNSPVKD